MVGTQQVGNIQGYQGKAEVYLQLVFLVGQILLASIYYLGISLYQPT